MQRERGSGLLVEVVMPKQGKQLGEDVESKNRVERMASAVGREVRALLGEDATFEQRRDAAAELMKEVLRKYAVDDHLADRK